MQQPISWVNEVELIFLLLLLFVVVFAWLARKLETPYPIVLVVAGLLLGFVPGIPKVSLNPDVVFLIVLPPLLYSAAWLTPWREFKFNLVSICMLAFGLVGFTVFGVAQTSHWVFAGFDLRLGFVLGAVVATTDAIAATSIAKKIGLPQGIVDILEGESLINDATGLLALEFAIAVVVEGRTPTISQGIFRLAYLTSAGLALGYHCRANRGVVRTSDRRWPNRNCSEHSDPVRDLSRCRRNSRLRRTCGRRVRLVHEQQEFAFFFAQCSHANLGGVGRLHFYFEWAGIRADRTATAVRARRHP
jgi:hypothetical protein